MLEKPLEPLYRPRLEVLLFQHPLELHWPGQPELPSKEQLPEERLRPEEELLEADSTPV